jgi:hypothetical protein
MVVGTVGHLEGRPFTVTLTGPYPSGVAPRLPSCCGSKGEVGTANSPSLHSLMGGDMRGVLTGGASRVGGVRGVTTYRLHLFMGPSKGRPEVSSPVEIMASLLGSLLALEDT